MTKRAIVFGAGGAVGEATAHSLIARGWHVMASVHTRRDDAIARLTENGVIVSYDDLEKDGDWIGAAAGRDVIIFATHLTLTNAALERIGTGAKRVVAFSSNNVAVQPDAKAYSSLAAAEAALRARHPGAAIIRPTMIYGDPRLPTVTRLMRMARNWPLMPVPGSGSALVQPIFHEDLGRAAAWLADNDVAGVFAIGGPDAVTMRALYRYAARAIGSRARTVTVPLWLLRVGAPALAALNLYSRDQTLRANRDRLPVKQTELPPELVARVGLKEGLSRLASTLR